MNKGKLKIAIIGLDGANKALAKLIGLKKNLTDFKSTIPPYTPSCVDINFHRSKSS